MNSAISPLEIYNKEIIQKKGKVLQRKPSIAGVLKIVEILGMAWKSCLIRSMNYYAIIKNNKIT